MPLDETDWESDEFADLTGRATSDIPDRRLELMLVCAHPAIAVSVRTPLMLQVVLGVDAAAIAAAFAVAASRDGAATGAREETHPGRGHPLRDARTRATRRATARGPGGRLRGVRHRLAAGAAGHCDDGRRRAVNRCPAEALHLALVLAELLPDEPEVLGLAALVCLSEARRPARRADDGCFVPLEEQDVSPLGPQLDRTAARRC